MEYVEDAEDVYEAERILRRARIWPGANVYTRRGITPGI